MLGAGCAATAATTPAPPGDAATEPALALRVGLGPLVPARYRSDVRVRATDDLGTTVDARTDAAGWVRLALDPTRRWTLTAAEPGYAAVSLTGVPVPSATEVYLRATLPSPPAEVRTVRVSGVIRGRSAAGTQVLLDGAPGTLMTPSDDFGLFFDTWPGAPPARLVALELRGSDTVVNGALSAPLTFPANLSPPAVTLQLPAPPARPVVQELRVDLPTIGRVTAARFGAVISEVVALPKYTGSGVDLAVVGRSQLRRPTDPSAARWTIEAFEGDLAPELISATVRFEGPGPVRGSVTTRPSFRGVVPAFGLVTDLAATTGPAGAVTLTVDAQAWSRAAFTVSEGDVVVWEGYSLEQVSWRDRPLPPLPAGVTLAALWPSDVRQATVRACALRDWPLAPGSWASPLPRMALRNLVTVCEEGGATVAVR